MPRCVCGHIEHDPPAGECFTSGCKCRRLRAYKPGARIVFDDEDGKLDDLWYTGVDLHVERLSRKSWWAGIYLPDGTRITLHFDKAEVIEAPHSDSTGGE